MFCHERCLEKHYWKARAMLWNRGSLCFLKSISVAKILLNKDVST